MIRSKALTPLEIRCLELAADGLGAKAVGAQLGLSEGSVKNLWKFSYEKLGADNKAQAVAMALRRGFIK